jgi:hypothetical protein
LEIWTEHTGIVDLPGEVIGTTGFPELKDGHIIVLETATGRMLTIQYDNEILYRITKPDKIESLFYNDLSAYKDRFITPLYNKHENDYETNRIRYIHGA